MESVLEELNQHEKEYEKKLNDSQDVNVENVLTEDKIYEKMIEEDKMLSFTDFNFQKMVNTIQK